MDKIIVPIVVAVVSSGGFFTFIQFLIGRYGLLQALQKKIDYIDQGNIRLQILFLIHITPQRSEEIIKVAKKYFCDFKGNYYLTGIFKQYLDDNNLMYPDWFMNYKDKQ